MLFPRSQENHITVWQKFSCVSHSPECCPWSIDSEWGLWPFWGCFCSAEFGIWPACKSAFNLSTSSMDFASRIAFWNESVGKLTLSTTDQPWSHRHPSWSCEVLVAVVAVWLTLHRVRMYSLLSVSSSLFHLIWSCTLYELLLVPRMRPRRSTAKTSARTDFLRDSITIQCS